ncbi:PREDICTED: uncharacterized protein LOC107342716 [Paramuricea clavata]|uniref:PREDICTED: uncharacterized protein LOC107342716 n=1 Tax=Paramuricea clavata TaxID=317549 RepID=A0A6S7J5E4_PARCT|nr:PREDICTED: uncharacterized protein LOC107342716 [Paramuricea clavata]
MYEMRHLTETFQKLEGQSSCMSCSMKYNCCQQSGICRENKICKPVNSQEQPWKRFTCECPDGYHGDNCDQPITSCQGYAKGSRKPGMYKVVDSIGGPLYEVFCHFDSDSAWSLVQSYSFANRSLDQFKKSLSNNRPISENALTWSGYRLGKARMESIRNNSSFLQFTCDYEKHIDLNQSDFVQLELQNLKTTFGGNNVDVLELSGCTSYVLVRNGRGKIGEYDLNYCKIKLCQFPDWPLHVVFENSDPPSCMFNAVSCSGYTYEYFGSFHYSIDYCVKRVHRCIQNGNSTTQLWFSTRKMT